MRLLAPLLALAGHAAALRDNCAADLTPTEPVWQSTLPSEWTSAQVALFPERVSFFDEENHPLGPDALAASVSAALRFRQRSYMNLTFFHEGAGFRNQFGFYDVDSEEETMLFPDLSFYWPGCMESGDTVTVGPFEAGSHIGFFLKANGYNRGDDATTWYTDRERNVDGHPHVVTVHDSEFNVLLVGVEDLTNLGDEDFNDALFVATILEAEEDTFGDQVTIEDAIQTDDMVQTESGGVVECKVREQPTVDDSKITEIGTQYAILDGRALNDKRTTGQAGNWRVPDGWSVATDDDDIRSNVPRHQWGCTCVAFAEEISVATDLTRCAPPELEGDGTEEGDCVKVESHCGGSVVISRSVMEGNLPELKNPSPFGDLNCTTSVNPDAAASLPELSRNTYTCVGDGTSTGIRFGIDDLTPEASIYGFRVCADIETENVSGFQDPSTTEVAGIFADIEYTDNTFTYGLQGRTNTGTHDAERICVDLDPTLHDTSNNITNAGVHLLVRGKTGTVTFKNVEIEQRDGNVLFNDDCTIDGNPDYQGQEAFAWNAFGEGYSVEEIADANDPDNEYGNCLRMTSNNDEEVHGAEQIRVFDPPVDACGIYLGAAVSASTTGLADRFHSVYADVFFADGTAEYGIHVPFPTTTESDAFEYYDTVEFFENKARKAISSINVLALFSGHAGSACVTDADLRLITYCGGGGGKKRSTSSSGDPHYESLSGYKFDVQTVGEWLAYDDGELSLQIRHGASGNAAIATAVAASFHGSTFSLVTNSDGSQAPHIFVNRGEISVTDGKAAMALAADEDFINGFSVRRLGADPGQEADTGIPLEYIFQARRDNNDDDESYLVRMKVFVSSFGVQYLSVTLEQTAESLANDATGLFAITQSDVDTATKGRHRQSDVDDVMHRVIAPQFRVSDDTASAFKYNDEFSVSAGISGPEDAYDASSTDRYLAAASGLLDDEEAYVAAEASCARLSGAAKTSCIQDIMLTGDSSFAANYAGEAGAGGAITEASVTDTINVSPSGSDVDNDSATGVMASALAVCAFAVALVF